MNRERRRAAVSGKQGNNRVGLSRHGGRHLAKLGGMGFESQGACKLVESW